MTKTKDGELFTVNIDHVEQERLAGEAVKAYVGEEVFQKLKKVIDFDVISTKRKAGKKPDFVMPNLSNATASGLIDMLGSIREEIKDLQKKEGICKEALKARLELEEQENGSTVSA